MFEVDRGLKLITDEGAIREMASKVIEENPDELKSFKEVSASCSWTYSIILQLGLVHCLTFYVHFKQGKTRLFGFFVGKTLAASGGRADPVTINSVLKDLLDG